MGDGKGAATDGTTVSAGSATGEWGGAGGRAVRRVRGEGVVDVGDVGTAEANPCKVAAGKQAVKQPARSIGAGIGCVMQIA